MRLARHEELIWNMLWLLVGAPAMIAGIIIGVYADDETLVIMAVLIIPVILFITRKSYLKGPKNAPQCAAAGS